MKRRHSTFIALLRGINVGGHNKIPMAELRSLCADIGWSGVQSYIQSGNVVFSATAKNAALEDDLENSINRHFGLTIPVIVRTVDEWITYAESNPFADECVTEPNLVMLAVSKATPEPDAVEQLRERALNDERLVQVGNVLWVHFSGGVAKSKLSTALLDRLVGSPVTSRNWRTVLKLEEMARLLSEERLA